MPSLIPIYALGGFLILMMTFVIFDEGSLASRIRKGLSKTFSNNNPNKADAVIYSGLLLLFLSVGGFLAWLISLLSFSTLTIFSVSFVALLILSLVYSRFGKGGLNYDLMRTVLFTITTFTLGATLFASNTFWLESTGAYLFGITEILGIWLIVNWALMVTTNTPILKPIHLLLNIVFLIPYFFGQLNILEFVGVNYNISESIISFFFLPIIIFILNILMYAWFQKRSNEELMKSEHRNEYLIVGASSFITLGGVYVHGYLNYYEDLLMSLTDFRLEYMFGLTTLWLFTIDYILKKSIKNYNANFLVPWLVVGAGFISFVFMPTNPFIPMLLTSIGFILYMMADYLRKDSPVTMLFFYGSMITHLIVVTLATDFWSLFLLIIDIIILIYSSILHPENKLFTYFVAIVIPLTMIIKFLGFSLTAFVVLAIVGFAMVCCNHLIDGVTKRRPPLKKKPRKKSKTKKKTTR